MGKEEIVVLMHEGKVKKKAISAMPQCYDILQNSSGGPSVKRSKGG